MRKIATCCYCGTRAALVLRGEGRHELSCNACGAPLREMKAMPCAGQMRANPGAGPRSAPRRKPAPHPYDVPRGESEVGSHRERERYRQPAPRRKRRKPLLRKALEEIWDVVEDILD